MSDSWVKKFYRYFEDTFKDRKITRYSDGKGYSLIGEYSRSYKRQMGVGVNGNQLPFFRFYFDDDKVAEDSKYVPLIISVGVTTAVEEGGTTRYMLNDSTIKWIKPIEIVSRDDFYISKDNGRVFEKKGRRFREVDLANVYTRFLKAHMSDLRTLTGLLRRLKILAIRILPSVFLSCLAWVSGWLVWVIKGKRYTYDVITESILNSREQRQKVVTPPAPKDDIDFFGYKVSTWTLFSYSLLIVIASTTGILAASLALQPREGSLSGVLTIALAIISIVTYDKLLPLALRRLVARAAGGAFNLKYKSIKLRV